MNMQHIFWNKESYRMAYRSGSSSVLILLLILNFETSSLFYMRSIESPQSLATRLSRKQSFKLTEIISRNMASSQFLMHILLVR